MNGDNRTLSAPDIARNTLGRGGSTGTQIYREAASPNIYLVTIIVIHKKAFVNLKM